MSNISISQHKPDKILLNCDTVENIVNTYTEWYEPENNRIKNRDLTITTIANILFSLLAFISSFNAMPTHSKVLSGIILAVLFIYSIVCATKWIEAYKKVKGIKEIVLAEMLIERAKEDIKYTAIVRIAYNDKGTMLYLTGKDYFLPHCNMEKSLSIHEQEKQILQSLQEDFSIKENNVIKISPIDEKIYYSIKPVHGSVQMNAFAFFDVTIKEQIKEKLIEANTNRRWISIENMKKNPNAMATNKDVVELLESFPRPKECFENVLGNIKIIWNITSQCPYNCAICATHDEKREELNLTDKYNVLNSICTAKHMIKSVDFAGGDPLQFENSSTFIKSATEQLGTEKVSITTTGQGLNKLDDEEFINVVKHFEITIDAAHTVLKTTSSDSTSMTNSVSRNEEKYSDDNIDNITLISGHADSLTVNIPIINDDLSDEEMDSLVNKVLHIKNRLSGIDIDTSLIRLMPVGKMYTYITKDEYEKYNPIPVAKKIKEKLEKNNIPCKLHCSLRILPCFSGENNNSEHCNMLENKLGIDCAGNVFACAWGGYLQSNDPPTKNPFYLGNLTKVSLIKILTGASRTRYYTDIFNEIENKKHREFCSVISYYEKKKMFVNNDPLSKYNS